MKCLVRSRWIPAVCAPDEPSEVALLGDDQAMKALLPIDRVGSGLLDELEQVPVRVSSEQTFLAPSDPSAPQPLLRVYFSAPSQVLAKTLARNVRTGASAWPDPQLPKGL